MDRSPAPVRDHPRSTAAVFGRPLHAMLVPFPIACFVGALVTDLAYVASANVQWTNFSSWLLAAGLLVGGFAAAAGMIDHVADRRVRAAGSATLHLLLGIALWVVELFNAFVHSRDGWTSVWPTGLALSVVSVVLVAVTAWTGYTLVYRDGVGVTR